MIQTSEKNEVPRSPVSTTSSGVVGVDPASCSGNPASLEASTSSNDAQYPPDVKSGFDELCPVCGDKVSGYHYGLLTCESCKGFFKRTVQNKKVYSCVDNRNCHIDKSQRKRCPFCRFQKCLSVGMKLEAVRSDRMRGGRNKFGPMYKRDRALKQQAVRQQQQMIAQCQMHFTNGMTPVPENEVKPDPSLLMASASVPYSTSSSPVPAGCASPLPLSCPTTGAGSPNNLSAPVHGVNHSILRSNDGYNISQSYPAMIGALRAYQAASMAHQVTPVVPQLISDLKASMVEEREVKQKLLSFMQSEFDQTSHSHPGQFLQILCKMVDQLLFLMVEWARSSVFFKEMKVEDQMKLLQNCWSEILILDLVHRQVHDCWASEIILSSGHRISMDLLDDLGLGDMKARLIELIKKTKELKIDVNEYLCLKFLILLNPDVSGLDNRQFVEQSQERVNAALLEYCLNFYPNMKDKFGQILLRLPEIRLISIRGEEFLYYKHLNGEIPDQTLLMEMLHSKKK